jgi:hypothetical protein
MVPMRRALFAFVILVGCSSPKPEPLTPADFEVDTPWEESQEFGPSEEITEVQETADAANTKRQRRVATGKSSVPAAGDSVDAGDDAVSHLPVERPSNTPDYHSSSYHLTWQGKRIGDAREVHHRTKRGVRVIRTESIRVRRAGTQVESETEIIIDTDPQLRARRIELTANAGAVKRKGNAVRAKDGSWVLALDGEPVRSAPANAVPIELIPFLIAQQDADDFRGKVILAGYGFAVADINIQRDGRKAVATLDTEWGPLKTTFDLEGDGVLERAATDSTASVRVDADKLDQKFRAPELPARASIPVRGNGQSLVVDNVKRKAPRDIPGQTITAKSGQWQVSFERAPQTDKALDGISREVDRLLDETYDAPGAGAGDALALGRGDCTAHSSLFVQLASERGMNAKMVTGYRLDGKQLVRHRWVTVKRGKRWVSVDPTIGEPMQRGHYLALAVHGATTADIAMVDEVVFLGLGRAKATRRGPKVAQRP